MNIVDEMVVNIRESDGEFYAALEGTELEGVGATSVEALRDLADSMEFENWKDSALRL
jgi:hypothetical protein